MTGILNNQRPQRYGLLVTDADREQAAWQGILSAGLNLMAGSGATTDPGANKRAWADAGNSFIKNQQGYLNNTRQNRFGNIQAESAQRELQMREAQAKRQQAQHAAQQKLITGLPEDERLYAQADPQAFTRAKLAQPKDTRTSTQKHAESLFPDDPTKQRAYIERITTMAKAPTVNVHGNGPNYGTPPPGMAWARNQDNSVKLDPRGIPVALPIAGGPMEQKAQMVEAAQAASKKTTTRAANVVVEDIDRAINFVNNGLFTSGMFAEFMGQNTAGTDAADTFALLETVKSNMGMDRLQAMRDSSPTGGALGAINKSEMDLLQAAYGNLRQSQSREQLVYNLNRVKNLYLDTIHGPGNGPPRAKLGGGQGPQASTGITPEQARQELERRRMGRSKKPLGGVPEHEEREVIRNRYPEFSGF